jgi:hypothetical protein
MLDENDQNVERAAADRRRRVAAHQQALRRNESIWPECQRLMRMQGSPFPFSSIFGARRRRHVVIPLSESSGVSHPARLSCRILR